MPAITSSVPLYLVLIMPALATVMIGPGHADMYAIVGAMAAVLFVVLDLQGRPRGERHFVKALPVIAAGMFCGAVLPGLLIHLLRPQWLDALTWHAWATAGFVFALAGQRIVSWLVGLIDRRLPAILDGLASRFFGIKPEPTKDKEVEGEPVKT